MKKSMYLLLMLIFTINLQAQVTQEWESSLVPQFADLPVLTAADNSGYNYIAGTTGDNVNWVIEGLVLAKHDATGGQIWIVSLNGFVPQAIAIDNVGDVILAGYETDQHQSYSHAMVTKISSSGTLVWTQIYPGTSSDSYKTLSLIGTDIVCAGTTGPWNNNSNGFLVKYNSGGQQSWTTIINTPGSDGINKIVEKDGIIYCAAGGNTQAYVATIDVSTGVQNWIAFYTGASALPDYFTDLIVDDNSYVYATGSTAIASGKSKRDYNILTVKYNSSGSQLWVKTYDGTGADAFDPNLAMAVHYDAAESIVSDAGGNVYITGRVFNKSGSGKNAASSYDVITIKYSSAGIQQWLKIYGSNNVYEYPACMVANGSGLYITGKEGTETLLLKYDFAGNLIWTANYSVPVGNSTGSSISLAGNDIFLGIISTYIVLLKYNENSGSRLLHSETTSEINIYPNPSTDKILLSSDHNLGLITISDVWGKIVFSKLIEKNSVEIELQDLNSGIYFLNSNTSTKTLKFIKND